MERVTAMRGSQTILVFVALCMWLPALTGCGGPAATSTVSATDTAESLRTLVHHAAGGDATSVDVVGLSAAELGAFAALPPAERAATLAVYVAKSATSDLPPISGDATVDGEALRFTPRYPFARGVGYRIELDRNPLSRVRGNSPLKTSLEFQTAAPAAAPPTELTQIFPSSDQLPENQLKFYFHFSAPMSRGDAYRHIHLLDADGQELEAVFLELGEELWDAELQRFTLLCDPGRVKRGLVPREELGSVLQEGKDYTLVVDADWRDARGNPLKQEIRKAFHTIAPDHSPIDTTAWKIEPPKAGSRDPLVVVFPESLEHALLERMLGVHDANGDKIAGDVATSEFETRWQFTPATSWSAGEYKIVVDTALEDLAGNAIGRAFDTDTSQRQPTPIQGDTVSIPFVVR